MNVIAGEGAATTRTPIGRATPVETHSRRQPPMLSDSERDRHRRPDPHDELCARVEAIEVYLDRVTGGVAGRDLKLIRDDILLSDLDPDGDLDESRDGPS
jgi:hypothetical protein